MNVRIFSGRNPEKSEMPNVRSKYGPPCKRGLTVEERKLILELKNKNPELSLQVSKVAVIFTEKLEKPVNKQQVFRATKAYFFANPSCC